jgi:hypothetical protein
LLTTCDDKLSTTCEDKLRGNNEDDEDNGAAGDDVATVTAGVDDMAVSIMDEDTAAPT